MPRALLVPRFLTTAKPAGWWLIANVEMAVYAERFQPIPRRLLWARLPLHGLLIAWVYKTTTR